MGVQLQTFIFPYNIYALLLPPDIIGLLFFLFLDWENMGIRNVKTIRPLLRDSSIYMHVIVQVKYRKDACHTSLSWEHFNILLNELLEKEEDRSQAC